MSSGSDLIQATLQEFEAIETQFVALHAELDKTPEPDWVEQYCVLLGMIEETAQLVGLNALAACLEKLCENILMLDDEQPINTQVPGLEHWLENTLLHLNDPEEEQPCINLVNLVEDERWPSPLEVGESRKIIQQFADYIPETQSALEEPEHIDYTDIELSYQLAEDADSEVVAAFLDDTPKQLEDLLTVLTQIPFEVLGQESVADINKAQRLSHTIKGSGNLVGVTALACVAHEMETFFEGVVQLFESEPELMLMFTDAAELNCLAACDVMHNIIDNINESEPGDSSSIEDVKPLLSILQQWLEWMNEDSGGTFEQLEDTIDQLEGDMTQLAPLETTQFESSTEALDTNTTPAEDTNSEAFDAESLYAEAFGTEPPAEEDELTPAENNIEQVEAQPARAAAETSPPAVKETKKVATVADPEEAEAAPVDPLSVETEGNELVELVEEMSINLVQSQELYKRISQTLMSLKSQDIKIQEQRFELESAVDSRSMAQTDQPDASTEFDALELDRYDDIHRTSHQFVESISDNREIIQQLGQNISLFDGLIRQQQRFTDRFQHHVLQTDLQPFSHLSSRLHRCVRQAGRFTNKRVDLFVSGDDQSIDKTLVTSLADPLMHLLRNAVDHGIEADRTHKNGGGRIELQYRIVQRHVEITIQDDGQGINSDSVLTAAKKKGLVGEEILDREQILNLIFHPGFTTRTSVSQLSGRGIGLDAVANQVKQIGGSIDLKSVTGEGALFTLKIPLKKVTRHMVIIKLGGDQFAVDSTQLSQVIPPGTAMLERKGEQWVINWQDEWVPFRSIHQAMSKQSIELVEGVIQKPVLLVSHEKRNYAIGINALLNSFELVLKPFGEYVPKIMGLQGMTLLGDGTLIPVLHLPELLDAGENAIITSFEPTKDDTAPSTTVLVVDDSLSQRNAIRNLLADAGFSVTTAMDGVDAMEKVFLNKPALIITDLEMPRMNGIELASALHHDTKYSDIPLMMITSRTHTKHRNQAKDAGITHYITKPFDENDVIDSVSNLLLSTQSTAQEETTI